jgi:hypothetical protein
LHIGAFRGTIDEMIDAPMQWLALGLMLGAASVAVAACGDEDCGDCAAPTNCVEACGGEVVQSGCCPCPSGAFSIVDCNGTGGEGGQGGQGGDGSGGSLCPNAPNCLSNETPNDSDQDGCPDRCCVTSCTTDLVLVDNNDDGCNDTCADKSCAAESDCALFLCSFDADSCGAPSGVCSDFACETLPGGCGCDGTTYATACEAAEAGVGIDTTGAACGG